MSSETLWAPLVFGRTLARDFRFIVHPKDFGPEELRWAERWILGALHAERMDLTGQLEAGSRYAAVAEGTRMLVGRVCLHSDCCDRSVSPDYLRDEVGRPLFCFLGFAASRPLAPGGGGRGQCPKLPPMADPSFLLQFTYIKRQWNDRGHTKAELSAYIPLMDSPYSQVAVRPLGETGTI